MREYQGKVVLITGAGRGLGRLLAEAFAAQGAILAVNDINPDNTSETVERITRAGGMAREYLADVANKMAVQGMVNQIEDDWGRLDCLINNAAVSPQRPLLDMDEWDWRRTLDVNLTGSFLTTQSVARVMRAHGGGGVILNIGGPGGWVAACMGHAAYLTSKAALVSLTQAFAQELAPHHIRVNAVIFGEQPGPDVHLQVVQKALFLCSGAAAHLSGEVVTVK